MIFAFDRGDEVFRKSRRIWAKAAHATSVVDVPAIAGHRHDDSHRLDRSSGDHAVEDGGDLTLLQPCGLSVVAAVQQVQNGYCLIGLCARRHVERVGEIVAETRAWDGQSRKDGADTFACGEAGFASIC